MGLFFPFRHEKKKKKKKLKLTEVEKLKDTDGVHILQ
jgi:hypothetical protein